MQSHLHEHGQIAWERMRAHPLALNDPGIAERGFLPRLALVYQNDVAATALQMNSSRDANDAGTQHDCIVIHFGPNPRARYSAPPTAAAFSSSHHHVLGNPMEYSGKVSGWLKRSQRAVRA